MPTPTEMLAARAVKTTVAADLSSAQWRALAPAIRERAFFSARIINAELLNQINEIIGVALNPQPGDRINPEKGTPVTEGFDQATARWEMKKAIALSDYQPAAGTEGTIQDLRSNARLNLIIETNIQTAQGYSQFAQSQQEDILIAFPCQELFRAEERENKRDWPQRWTIAAQIAQDPKALYSLVKHGRMIARKDSRIWEELGQIGDDSLGNPYPPFAFRSGMWVRDIGRRESIELGIIEPETKIAQQTRGFNDTLEMSTGDMQWSLIDSLQKSLGPEFQRDSDGVIRRIA